MNTQQLILIIAITLGLATTQLRAERPQTNNPNAFILASTAMQFTQGGAAIAPISLLLGLGEGKISPFVQFLLLNQLMSSCVKDVLKYTPHEKHSYKRAKFTFDYAVCRVMSCVKQGLLFAVLSGKEGNGMEQGDPNGGLVAGLASSMGGGDSCIEGSAGIDPALLQVAQQQAQRSQGGGQGN